jgi:hypothetical protein
MATEQPGTQTDHTGEGITVTNVQRIADELVLDRIDALRVLRADTAEEKGALLEQIAGPGKPEQDIVRELSKLKPLWRPDRFEEAHRWVMRSLEVLDRNGVRSAKLPRLGPLKVVATYVVQQITRWIVKGHQNTVVTRVRKLYERREANAEWGSAEHRMLRRARLDAQRVEQGYKADQLGLPTFLLGGAIFSTIVSGLQSVARAALENTTGQVIFAAVLALVFFGLAWAALYAAAVARRRIRLCMDQPLKALWETIGACGNPPRDESYNFAIYAIVLLVLAWVAIPLAFWLVFH